MRLLALTLGIVILVIGWLGYLSPRKATCSETFRGRARERPRARSDQKEEEEISLTETEIRSIERGLAKGGNLNCAVCAPCMNAVKACHSSCKSCSDFCGTRKCVRTQATVDQNVRRAARVLNSYTAQNLRQEGDPADRGKVYRADNSFV